MNVESLESRKMFAAAPNDLVVTVVDNGYSLVVKGSDYDDRINISRDGIDTIVTSAGVEIYRSSEWREVIAITGRRGDDRIVVDDSIDVRVEAWGGKGNDYIQGGSGTNYLRGFNKDGEVDNGGDTLVGGSGINYLYGGNGSDLLVAGTGTNSFYGGEGLQDMVSYKENHVADLWLTINGTATSGVKGSGKDTIGKDVEDLRGGSGNDLLVGSSAANFIAGLDGNDTIHGLDGGDEIYGGDDHDKIYGGGGGDLLAGWGGNDTIYGGEGDDFISGGTPIDSPNSSYDGDDGDDKLMGEGGNDRLLGKLGNDKIDGGEGNDYLHGGKGSDRMIGGAGNDVLDSRDGSNGNDTLFGGREDRYSATKDYDFAFINKPGVVDSILGASADKTYDIDRKG